MIGWFSQLVRGIADSGCLAIHIDMIGREEAVKSQTREPIRNRNVHKESIPALRRDRMEEYCEACGFIKDPIKAPDNDCSV